MALAASYPAAVRNDFIKAVVDSVCCCRRPAFDTRDTALIATYPEMAAPHVTTENLSIALLKGAHVKVVQALLLANPFVIQGAVETAEIWKCLKMAIQIGIRRFRFFTVDAVDLYSLLRAYAPSPMEFVESLAINCTADDCRKAVALTQVAQFQAVELAHRNPRVQSRRFQSLELGLSLPVVLQDLVAEYWGEVRPFLWLHTNKHTHSHIITHSYNHTHIFLHTQTHTHTNTNTNTNTNIYTRVGRSLGPFASKSCHSGYRRSSGDHQHAS
jgi:hypothetical protein